VTNRPITDTAILIGWSPDGHCVYSAAIPLGEYRSGEHAWDRDTEVKSLRLEKLRGFLFDAGGSLTEEFENTFDVGTGRRNGGWTRHEDGRFQRHDA
jgi:hypothetical protein